MAPALTAALEPLLEQLEAQERYAYALRPCGADLFLALVERWGQDRRAFLLQACDEQLWIQVTGSSGRVCLAADQLQRLWKEPCHG